MKNFVKILFSIIYFGIANPVNAEPGVANTKAEKMIEKLDKDQDGKISEKEFLDSKKEHFLMADHNNDGMLDSAEIKDMHKKRVKGKGKNKSN
jgi:Ca2+-binding EF-hand superfamily protein